MNFDNIVRITAAQANVSQATARNVLKTAIYEIADLLSIGVAINLHGLATFTVEHKPARTGRNPQTGAAIEIPAKRVVKIKPAKALSDAANGVRR